MIKSTPRYLILYTDVSSIMVYNTLNGEYKFVESFDFPLESNKKIQIRRVGGQIVQNTEQANCILWWYPHTY